MQEVRPLRTSTAAPPSPEPLAKSASLPELAAPAEIPQRPAEPTQAPQPDQAPEPMPRIRFSISADNLQSQGSAKQAQSKQIIEELVEVLDLYQDKPGSQEDAKTPQQKPVEQKPEQANKWLAFQKLVSQQAAEEAASQKVGAQLPRQNTGTDVLLVSEHEQAHCDPVCWSAFHQILVSIPEDNVMLHVSIRKDCRHYAQKSTATMRKAGPPAHLPSAPRSAPQRAVSPARSSSAPARRPPAMCQAPMKPPSNNRRPRRVRPQGMRAIAITTEEQAASCHWRSLSYCPWQGSVGSTDLAAYAFKSRNMLCAPWKCWLACSQCATSITIVSSCSWHGSRHESFYI